MADIVIEITVPDAYVTRAFEALTGMADKRIRIEFERDSVIYDYTAKESEETNKEFAERVCRNMIINHIKAYEKDLDYDRYHAEMKAVLPASEDVPDNILT
jgi:hypothetical protein